MKILIFILAFIIFFLIVNVFMIIKTEITYRNYIRIAHAVYDYLNDCLEKEVVPMVTFQDIGSFDDAIFRLFDFGMKNILPKGKYEVIKPYLKPWKEVKGELKAILNRYRFAERIDNG